MSEVVEQDVSQAEIYHKGRVLPGLIKLMRPKQWIKNGFVLAPLLFAKVFTDPVAIYQTFSAMVLFCIASSATYILNDIQDIENDRKHPVKSKKRQLASGQIKIKHAIPLLILLYILLITAIFIFPKVMIVIGCYIGLNYAYSLYLKHIPVIDIFTIAIGFVLRVVAGGVALDVEISSWMFVTTLCLALYLASIKRRQELLKQDGKGRKVLEKYSISLIDKYCEMSSTGAMLFYSLFIISSRPEMIMTIPLVLFGLFRYWYIVETLEGGESPSDALLSDFPLLAVILIWIGMCLWAFMAGNRCDHAPAA